MLVGTALRWRVLCHLTNVDLGVLSIKMRTPGLQIAIWRLFEYAKGYIFFFFCLKLRPRRIRQVSFSGFRARTRAVHVVVSHIKPPWLRASIYSGRIHRFLELHAQFSLSLSLLPELHRSAWWRRGRRRRRWHCQWKWSRGRRLRDPPHHPTQPPRAPSSSPDGARLHRLPLPLAATQWTHQPVLLPRAACTHDV